MKPYRLELSFVDAARDIEQTDKAFDKLVAYANDLGLIFEDGGSHEMDEADVIPGSPLDDRIVANELEGRLLLLRCGACEHQCVLPIAGGNVPECCDAGDDRPIESTVLRMHEWREVPPWKPINR